MKKHIPRGAQLPLFTALLLWVLLLITACGGCKVEIGTPNNPPTPPTNTYPTTPPTELPPATQTGAGTLGCKINGRVWTFWIPPIALTSEQEAFVSESDGYGTANIRARIWSADTFVDQYRVYHDLRFSFSNPDFEPRILRKAGVNGGNEFRFYVLTNNPGGWYFPDTANWINTNHLIIDRIDKELNIISGRFDMLLYRGNNYGITDRSDSLIITDGRFDFKYSQQ